MRPTPAETIAGVRRILRDIVAPAVTDEYARTRLREVRAVLAQLDWDDAPLRLRTETETMRGLVAEFRRWADEPTTRPTTRAPETFAELNATHAEVAAQLAEAASRLDTWCREHPHDEDARALRQRLIRALAER
ncbi:hypothetical protein [Actinophytocola sp.]|jgi:hypothetical protein|uniref:hypothetical protein n=1 Tax=Actinophytocola sp. TaxID=1872138 RepID=UPI002EDB22C8